LTVREYGADEIQLARVFGDLAALAIEKASGLAREKKRSEQLEITNKIARAVGSALDPDELFRTIASEIGGVVSYDRLVIASFGLDRRSFIYYFEDADVQIGPPNDYIVRRGQAQKVYGTKKILNIPNLLDTEWRNDRACRAGYRSVLMVPIIQDDDCIAFLRLTSKIKGCYDADHEELLSSLAGHIAIAIKNADLYRKLRLQAENLWITNKIARAVGSALDPDELFRTIASEIGGVVPYDRLVIASLGPDRKAYVYYFEDADVLLGPPNDYAMRRGPSRKVLETNKIINIPNLLDTEWRDERLCRAGYRSVLSIPIIQDDDCITFLRLTSKTLNGFDTAHEELLSSLAGHIAIAIKNADLYRKLRLQAEHLWIADRIAQAIGSNLEPESLFRTIAK
jgi:GAF domain-containing protein